MNKNGKQSKEYTNTLLYMSVRYCCFVFLVLFLGFLFLRGILMMPLNMSYLHCLQHVFFGHLFIYIDMGSIHLTAHLLMQFAFYVATNWNRVLEVNHNNTNDC